MSAKLPPKTERRLGRYILRRALGKGGGGQVFLAWLVNPTGEPMVCCIKVPPLRYAADRQGCQRFLHEARLCMRLGSHPNIVLVFDVNYHGRMPFLAMEYVDGVDLNNLLKRLRRWGRGLSKPGIHCILASGAAGLHHAHSGRTIDGKSVAIVHRDVTPSNMLVTRDGIVKLADFGIGVALADGTTGSHWRGTPRYMSPEHLNCTPCPEMDIYALGVIAWELVENRAFREGLEGPQHYPAIIDGKIPEMRSRDRRLVSIIESCLDPDPRQRPTAAEFIEALARCPEHSRDPSILEQELAPIIGTRRSSGASKGQIAAVPPSPELDATLAAFGIADSDAPPSESGAAPRSWYSDPNDGLAPGEPERDAPRLFRRRRPDPEGEPRAQPRRADVVHPAASEPEPEAEPAVSSSETTREQWGPVVSTSETTRKERREPDPEPTTGSDAGPGSPPPASKPGAPAVGSRGTADGQARGLTARISAGVVVLIVSMLGAPESTDAFGANRSRTHDQGDRR